MKSEQNFRTREVRGKASEQANSKREGTEARQGAALGKEGERHEVHRQRADSTEGVLEGRRARPWRENFSMWTGRHLEGRMILAV